MVYSYVDAAQREGIWSGNIHRKSNLHQSVVNRCIKILETKNLIKQIRNAKYPAKKVFILSGLQPTEEVTGGPFYTDGTLDEEYVHQLCLWIENHILRKSWYLASAKSKKKGKSKMTAEDAEAARAEAFQQSSSKEGRMFLPMPPGYTAYPTTSEITRAINESGLSQVKLRDAEVAKLLDLLCWDGRIMKLMNGRSFKTILKTNSDGEVIENGLTESPCGRCPVFDLCEEGGPVNARTCTYFREWLDF